MILTILITLMAIVGLVTFFTFRKREEVPRNPWNPGDWCKSCSIMPDGRRICLTKQVCRSKKRSPWKKETGSEL